MPDLGKVEIQLKAGRAHNELSRYRFDVWLHFTTTRATELECSVLDWQSQKLDWTELRASLAKSKPDLLLVKNVPNARISQDLAALQILRSSPADCTSIAVREQMISLIELAYEPEEFWSFAVDSGYFAEIASSAEATEGCFDVTFRRHGLEHVRAASHARSSRTRSLKEYANDPMRAEVERLLVPELHAYLAARLPDYMVPASFVLLEEMPLGTSGKVDRKVLPAPDQSVGLLQSAYVPPRTDVERELAAIWSELLRLERIGTQDNFFRAGGHSLLATQVVSRVRTALAIELPLRAMFEEPTIAGLAKRIEALRMEGRAAAHPLVKISREGELPASYAQQRLWFLDQLEPGGAVYNVPTVVRLRGALDHDRLQDAVNATIARHETLR